MTDMLRMAVIGCGWAGARQIEATRELGRKIAVTMLVDSDAAQGREQAARFAIEKTATDYALALADPNVDAVSICLPHALHMPVAVAAARAGKHVLCEKPLAPTVAEATAMIAAAEASGVRLYVAENEVYRPHARFLRRVVRGDGPIGTPVAATFAAGFGGRPFGYAGRRAWLTQPSAGGTGTWMLHGVHSVAQLRHIFGEVESVYLREHHAPAFPTPEIEGTMTGVLTLASGLHLAVVQTCEAPGMRRLGGYAIHGDRGSVAATAAGYTLFDGDDDGDGPPAMRPYPDAGGLSDYARELEAFADHVAGIAAGPTTGRSERRSLAVVQAGYESARSGRPVHLRERFGPL